MIDAAGRACFSTTALIASGPIYRGDQRRFCTRQGVTTLSFNATFPTYHPQNSGTCDDVFLTRGQTRVQARFLMNNYQDSSRCRRSVWALNSGNSILNWNDGKTKASLA